MKRAVLAALVFVSAFSHAQVRTKSVKSPAKASITTVREVYTGETLGQEKAEQPFQLTLDYMTYAYTEPDVMKISGNMPGIRGVYRLHFNTVRPRFLNFDVRYAQTSGNHYDGGVMHFHSDGTTTTTPSTESSRDSILDAKVQFGWSMLNSRTNDLELLAGLGVWNLNNKVSGSASYAREANYIFLPATINSSHKFGSSMILTYGLDLNVWVAGTTKSKLSDLGGEDMTHIQPSGMGYKLHIDTNFKLGRVGLIASIFHQGWDVEQSNVIYLSDKKGNTRAMVEPENNTRMTGLALGATF